MIFVIDDDEIMAKCVAKACGKKHEIHVFGDALAAMKEISDGVMPKMILMDVMLTGPDGFTFLNELISYEDTSKIPVVLISEIDFFDRDLSVYGVVATLNKDTFKPEDVRKLVEEYAE